MKQSLTAWTRRIIILIGIFLVTGAVPSASFGGSAALQWDRPSTNTDATTLTNLAGYKIYYGRTAGASVNYESVIDVGLTNTPAYPNYILNNLTEGSRYFFSVTAYNTLGNESSPSNEVSKLIPSPPPPVETIYPLAIYTTSPLPGATLGVSVSLSLMASGGLQPYNWSISAGSLPSGLTLNAVTGVISGIPSSAGASQFTAKVTDSRGSSSTKDMSIMIYPAISIATESLPETTIGASYSAALLASGGKTPYTWKITSGLPPGISLLTDSGRLLGIPSTAGNWQFIVTATDANSRSITKTLSIMVYPAPQIITSGVNHLYQGHINTEITFGITGGMAPYTWSVTSGSMPAGLILNAQNGTVSGTPTRPGTYNFTLEVSDISGIKSSATYRWTILALPPGNVDFMTSGSESRVDGYDLIALSIAFASTKDSPGWNPLADLNGDGIIDDIDFSILQNNFGKSEEP